MPAMTCFKLCCVQVWAMGCIFVEVCGGPLPYEKITTLAELTKEMLIKRRVTGKPTPTFEGSSSAGAVPGELQAFQSSSRGKCERSAKGRAWQGFKTPNWLKIARQLWSPVVWAFTIKIDPAARKPSSCWRWDRSRGVTRSAAVFFEGGKEGLERTSILSHVGKGHIQLLGPKVSDPMSLVDVVELMVSEHHMKIKKWHQRMMKIGD